MVSKSRVPMQVAPEFENRVKKIQGEIMKRQGVKISLRDLTEKIAKIETFVNLEKEILKNANFDIKINLDKRRK